MNYEWAKGKFLRDVNMDNKFIESMTDFARQAAEEGERQGHKFTPAISSLADDMAYMHLHLSEAWDAVRNKNNSDLEDAFADVIIRILHVSHVMNLRLPGVIINKLKNDNTRTTSKT